ncbi:PEP-CTERM motif protein [Phycisphaerae bacterium RAS2]|nr:PEP-CTERM motif protein [Phycisphaerae bacterium RAS2]
MHKKQPLQIAFLACSGAVFTSMVARPLVSFGDIVVSQLPTRINGAVSDTAFLDFGSPAWQLAADDFMLNQAATISRCTFWGFYGSNFDKWEEMPPASQTIRLQILEPRPVDGMPGNVLYEESFVDPPRIETGLFISLGAHPREFRYDVDLTVPWSLAPGTQYWLGITQIGVEESRFRWEVALGNGSPYAFTNPFTDWRRSGSANLAFQLIAVPEPSSLALLGLGAMGLIARRRK